MKRIYNIETKNFIGQKVRVAGFVHSRRDHGKIVFIDLRDKTGILQVVCPASLVEGIKEEWVISIEGEVKKRPASMVNPDLETGEIELQAEKIDVLAQSETLPFDLKNLNLSLPKLLDFRPLVLRNRKIQAIFEVENVVVDEFRETMKKLGFFEFQAPALVASATEGGAEIFHVDYYDYDAYLAQSPQLYKQILVGSFERVFTITKVYRAEPSVTTRHIAEFVSMDVEMGFIDSWEDLMEVCQTIIQNILSRVQKDCASQLKLFGIEKINIPSTIPRLKMREAQEIIFKRKNIDHRQAMDLDPDDEKEICDFASQEYHSDLIFITHYPTKKRPFYTFPDPNDPDYTLSFDLLYKGLEIVTGGQRIHHYQQLLENIKKFGLDPKSFQFYLQAFKYGMPPEGGFAIGLERLVKQILGLKNIREASLFPRDMERIDLRLSQIQNRKKEKE